MSDVLNRHLVPTDLTVDSQLGEEAILLNLESGTYYGLDPIGAWIWEQLKQGLTAKDISALMVSTFSVSLEQVQNDLRDFLADLLQNGLVEEK